MAALRQNAAALLSAVLVLTVFLADLSHPAGLAAPLLYLPAVLLTLPARRLGVVVGVATAAIVLTVVAYPLSPEGGNPTYGVLNRAMVVLSILVIAPLILKQIRVRETMRRLSLRDQLTGAYNRRHLASEAEAQIAIASRYEQPLSLALLDADHFKSINDKHGHEVGDAVLRSLVGVMLGTLREADLVARVGGEEFAILMPGVGLANARQAVERLRRAIAATDFQGRDRPISVRISGGVATLSDETATLTDLMRAADAMLYEAKDRGRDRIEPAADPERGSDEGPRAAHSS